MKKAILLLILVCGCKEPFDRGDFTPAIAVGVGFTSVQHTVVVEPTPVTPAPDNQVLTCDKCDGTGKVKMGRREVKCRKCNGGGKLTPDGKPLVTDFQPEVLEWVIPADKQHDMDEYRDCLALAREMNRVILIDFAPSWCKPCQELVHGYLDTPKVSAELGAKYVLLRVQDGDLAESMHIENFAPKPYPVIAIIDGKLNCRTFRPNAKTFMQDLERAVAKLGE